MTVVSQETTQAEDTSSSAPTETNSTQGTGTKKCLALWYHEADLDLLRTLDAYLQLLYRRLGTHIDRSYFSYPKCLPKAPVKPKDNFFLKTYEKDQARYEEELKTYQSGHASAVHMLEHAVLFLPCISNSFIEQFWNDMEHDPALRTLLETPQFQIMPIFIRPAETGIAVYSDPLSAYEGYQREVACQQITAMIEAALVNHCTIPTETPMTALFSSSQTIRATLPSPHTTIDLLRDALAPVTALFEQTSAHVAEFKQLAIAERSQRSTIESEMEVLRQQLVVLQAQQQPFFTKLGRWFRSRQTE